jgi:biopolymer transport protein TolQ
MLNASWVVQAVVLILLLVSVFSWAAIFRKILSLSRVKNLNDEFEREFWSGKSLNELFAAATQNAKLAGPMERIFASGMREYQKLRERRISDSGLLMDGARRAMRASLQREMDEIESNLSMLASVGSVSPYIGLFGTVWGIMHAFTGLAALQQVTLAKVAPGIAEALVATAIGLFAAIPAVLAFNRFSRDIDRVANKLETFIEEFSNILQRNVGTQVAAGR